jgi:hypothetical protein
MISAMFPGLDFWGRVAAAICTVDDAGVIAVYKKPIEREQADHCYHGQQKGHKARKMRVEPHVAVCSGLD